MAVNGIKNNPSTNGNIDNNLISENPKVIPNGNIVKIAAV